MLTEGLSTESQAVLKNAAIVTGLANRVRGDSQFNASVFPPNAARNFRSAPDVDVTTWFLENLDNILDMGYDGEVFPFRQKKNLRTTIIDWVIKNYLARQHTWEDISGKLGMVLHEFFLLQRTNNLEELHANLPKFRGIHAMAAYIKEHYSDMLPDLKQEAKKKALEKLSKSAKLYDGDDYRLYAVFNRAAAVAIGLNTSWCTANSNTDANFYNYANQAILFQIIPYGKKDADGKKTVKDREKCQFSADRYLSFKNSADASMAPETVRSMYPYLGTDLIGSLTANASKLQTALDAMSDDPVLNNVKDAKVIHYNIADEIKKLDAFKDAGFFTDKKRPSEEPEQTPNQINEKGTIMSNVDKDVAAMLTSLKKYDKLTESVLGMTTIGEGQFTQHGMPEKKPGLGQKVVGAVKNVAKKVADKVAPGDDELLARLEKETGGKRPMEESSDIEEVEESKDDDRAASDRAMANYTGPIEKLPYKGGKKERKEAGKSVASSHIGKGGQTKGKGGKGSLAGLASNVSTGKMTGDRNVIPVVGSGKKIDESAEPDAEVIEWMQRFSKLGNMKGYGR